MIGYLRGLVVERFGLGDAAAELFVDVGGVGYRVAVSPRLAASMVPGDGEVALYVHTHVREAAITLYGFDSAAELQTFELLLGAHGVGPALALSIVATHPPSRLGEIVAAGDLDALTLVPGVGKKTAARLLVELKARFDQLEVGTVTAAETGSSLPSVTADVSEALSQLGYGSEEVRTALRGLPSSGDAADLLRQALRELAPRAGEATVMSPRHEILPVIPPGGEAGDHRLEPAADEEEISLEASLRPRRLEDFVGQRELRERLGIVLEAARKRAQPVDHLLFAGPPGLGKTTLAGIVASEMRANFRITSGPALVRSGDIAAILTALEPGDVLFIDEIHRLGRVVEEVLYPAMEDFQLDLVIGKGPMARSIRLDLPRFTLVGATTRTGLVTGPLRDRFGFVARLDHYSDDELETIVVRSARLLGVESDEAGAAEIARRSRGTPRLAIRLLRRVRDFVEVKGSGVITYETAQAGLEQFGVDELGLDRLDRSILETLCVSFAGRPVGLSSLAVSVGEEQETVEYVYEPFLLKSGLVLRTPRGRLATERAYCHLGLKAPAEVPAGEGGLPPSLFDEPDEAIETAPDGPLG